MLFKLVEQPAFLGKEENLIKVISESLPKCAKINIDKNSNLIATIGVANSKEHILLDAHLDQIGLVVTNICDGGFLKVALYGGMDRRVLPGTLVTINGKKNICGIISSVPPHLSKNSENKFLSIDELLVDTGLNSKEVNELVKVGDYVSFSNKPLKLLNNSISAPGLDNRAGVAALIKCAHLLEKECLNKQVSFLFSTGEEVSGVGAKTAAFKVEPSSAISVDVSFASQPSVPKEKCGELGKGPMIGVSPTLSKEVSSKLIEISKGANINYQVEIMSGKTGTNADYISVSKSGIKTGLVSIPLRYMHTPAEVINLTDIENTAKLLALYVKGGLEA